MPKEVLDHLEENHGSWMANMFNSMSDTKKAEWYMWVNNDAVLKSKWGPPMSILKWWGHEPGLTYEEAKKRTWADLAWKPKI